jgi:hypothetical protein
MIQINTHADDVDISRNHKALKEAVEELDDTAQETRLIISQAVSVNKKTHNQCKQTGILVGGCRFERSFRFSYLHSINK